MTHPKQKGFTLIELLVVIAIIGILASVILIALSSAKAKARDAKRIGDIKQLVTALSLYEQDNPGTYPVQAAPQKASIALTPALVSGTPSYAGSIPDAPVPPDDPGAGQCIAANGAYTWNDYVYTSDGTTYTLDFCLGGQTGGFAAGQHTASPGGIN